MNMLKRLVGPVLNAMPRIARGAQPVDTFGDFRVAYDDYAVVITSRGKVYLCPVTFAADDVQTCSLRELRDMVVKDLTRSDRCATNGESGMPAQEH